MAGRAAARAWGPRGARVAAAGRASGSGPGAAFGDSTERREHASQPPGDGGLVLAGPLHEDAARALGFAPCARRQLRTHAAARAGRRSPAPPAPPAPRGPQPLALRALAGGSEACTQDVEVAHLLLRPGRLQPNAEGLAPFVARRARQAVEPGLGVDAAVRLAGREADVGDQGALQDERSEPAAPAPAPPCPAGRAPTSSRSSQCVPLPRKPAGQEPQAQEPSAKLLHSAPGKQGLDKQPSAGGRAG